MTILARCPNCKVGLRLPEALIAREARCPKCQVGFTVPSPSVDEAAGDFLLDGGKTDSPNVPQTDEVEDSTAASVDEEIRVCCNACLETYSVDMDLSGKKIRCRKCQGPLYVPDVFRQREKPAVAPPRSSLGGRTVAVAAGSLVLVVVGAFALWPAKKAPATKENAEDRAKQQWLAQQADTTKKQVEAARKANEERARLEEERRRLEAERLAGEQKVWDDQQRQRKAEEKRRREEESRRRQEAAKAQEEARRREEGTKAVADELQRLALRERRERSAKAAIRFKEYSLSVDGDQQLVFSQACLLLGDVYRKRNASAFDRYSPAVRREAAYLIRLCGDLIPEDGDATYLEVWRQALDGVGK